MGRGLGILAAAVVLSSAVVAMAFDATGTWEGSYKCTQKAGSVVTKFACPEDPNNTCLMKITQDVDEMHIRIEEGEVYFEEFEGLAHARDDDPNRGNASAEYCYNDGDPLTGGFSEVIDFKKVDLRAGKETIKGKSVWQSEDGPGKCKYSFKRTSATDPGVPDCNVVY